MRYSENIEKILSGSSSSTGTTRIEWWRRVTFSKLKGLPVLSSWIYWRRCENFLQILSGHSLAIGTTRIE